MTIARDSDQPTLKVLAIRAIVAMAGRDKEVTIREKVAMLSELLAIAPRTDEKRLVLATLPKIPCRQTVQLAVKTLDDPQLASDAAAAIVGIAAVRNPPSEVKAALEKAAHATRSPAIENLIRQRLNALKQAPR
jgi:hypothetical protein